MSSQYIFDKDSYSFKKVKTPVWTILRRIMMIFVASISMAILYYIVFAVFFSTEEERQLRQENRMYESELPVLESKERFLSDAVDGLRVRDDMIYEEIFHTSAPNLDSDSSLDFLVGIDSVPDDDIVRRSAMRLDIMESRAADIEANFRRIIESVSREDFKMPPMNNPLKDFSFAQTGASVGEKINPFYKVKVKHDGLDLIAQAGEPVHAAADGIVTDVVRSRKGLGNVISIDHGNGYVTKYAHLADMEVRKGQSVKKGRRIGYVGVSGNSFAPHLHYEVLRDTSVVDPVNHFFASVTPDEYVNMLIMSVSTGQSMD